MKKHEAPVTIIILYEELAGYFISCVNELALSKNVDSIIIYCRKVNKEAPFQFELNDKIVIHDKGDLMYSELLNNTKNAKPSLIFCGGWIDKNYIKVCFHFNRNNISTVLGFDNKWDGSLRQKVLSVFFRIIFKKVFKYAWVPGVEQRNFAIKLGFELKNIKLGAYSADVELFGEVFKENLVIKKGNYPHVILYVGRYVQHKGIFDMWEAFIQLQKESPNDWELWCIGTGDQFENKVEHPKIKHFGFVQPKDLSSFIEKSGVYILPSHFEPWGVTIHEFAVAGMPIICSDKVGAATHFVENNKNGYIFNSGNIQQLKKSMKTIMSKSDDELNKMGKYSHELGLSITPKKWVETLKSFIN